MSNDVEELLQVLYTMVQDAKSSLVGVDRCVINRDKILAILDEINHNLPGDLKQARSIVQNRNDILNSAKREAEAIRRSAEERAKQLINTDEVMSQARQRANDIVAKAEKQNKELTLRTREYVDEVLKETEESVAKAMQEVRRTRQEFRSAISQRHKHEKKTDVRPEQMVNLENN